MNEFYESLGSSEEARFIAKLETVCLILEITRAMVHLLAFL